MELTPGDPVSRVLSSESHGTDDSSDGVSELVSFTEEEEQVTLPPLQNMKNNYANYLLLQRVVQERKAERDALTAKRIEAYEVRIREEYGS